MVITLSLHSMNHAVHTVWHIDAEQLFDHHVQTSITLHAPLCAALATFIIKYAPAEVPHTLWIQNGILRGVEPTYTATVQPQSSGDTAAHICTHYNAIILEAVPATRSFTLITKQRRWSELSSHHALALLKQLVI